MGEREMPTIHVFLFILLVTLQGVSYGGEASCTEGLTPQSSAEEVVHALKCVERKIDGRTLPPSGEHASLPEDVRVVAESLKNSFANLGKKATGGIGGSLARAKALVEDYNELIRETKAVPAFENDSFIGAAEKFQTLDDANQAASAIADLAKGMESYLGNFKASTAFEVSYAELAKNASKGVGGSDARIKVLKEEYNLLMREMKKVFPKHSFIQSQKEFETIYDANDAAASIARSAKSMEEVLAGLQK